MSRKVETLYGCFRCGEIKPTLDYNNDTDKYHCGLCGESSIVTFQQSLDMLNGYYIDNKKAVLDLLCADEYYLDYEDEEYDDNIFYEE